MRFLDIAIGSGYGAICICLIAAMSPVAFREAAVSSDFQARLDKAISAYIENAGLPFLTNAPLPLLCESVAAASNSTLVLQLALASNESCDGSRPPSSPLASSSLTLELPGRTLVIRAWLARQ